MGCGHCLRQGAVSSIGLSLFIGQRRGPGHGGRGAQSSTGTPISEGYSKRNLCRTQHNVHPHVTCAEFLKILFCIYI